MANVLYGDRERVGGKDTKSPPPGSHSMLSQSAFKNDGKPLMTTPEQIVPVHDIHRQDSSPSLSQQLLRYSSSESIQSLKSSPYHWTVSDTVYPGIPFQVAHYMCETNPDLLSQMEAVLHGSSGSIGNMKHNSTPNATNRSPKVTSSFDHMCSVTDALALQESVIGDSCKQPAHPDVVAEVVAKVKNQYVRNNQRNLPHVTTSDGDKLSDHSTDIDSQILADLSHESSSSFLECSPTSPYAPNTAFHDFDKNSLSDASKEMHRFPKDRITTVVERRSWWSSKPKEDDSGSVHDQEVVSEPDSNRSSVSTRGRPRDESLSQYTESNSNAREYPTDTRSVASEIESIVSERYEVESNFSERYDLQSNSSEVSGLEEEMFRIKKLLLEVPTNQDFAPTLGMEDGRLVDRQVHFEILREKASLEGQIEALTMELGRSNQEKTALRAQLATSRTQLNSQTNTVRISKQEAQDAIMKMENLEKAFTETEDELTRLRGVVDSKTEATIQSSEVAKMAEEEAHQLKIILQEMRVEAESRDGAVRGLKTKVAELHVELQNALQAKNKLESDLQVSKSRIDSEQNMKEWYRQQLQESQTAKGKLHQDIITLKAFSADCESSVEKLRFERDQARLQLSELKERGVREKEGLLRHLKSIEADVREREAVFQQFQKEQGPVEEIVASQLVKMEQEKKRMAEEAFFITDLKHNLEAARAEVDSKNLDVARLEKEVAQLMKQVTVQNKTVGERDLEIHTLRERLLDLESRVKEQQVALNVNEESLAAAKREVMARDVELTSIRTEKGDIDDTLVEVRGNVLKLDGRLKQMKEELTAKGEAVDKLQQEKAAVLERLQSENLVNEQLKKKLAKTEEEARVLREEVRSASLSRVEVEEVRKSASVALSDAMETKETANRLSLDLNRLVNENQMLREKIDTLEKYDVSQLTRDDVATKLTVKLTEVRKALELKEKELQGVLVYNEELKSSLEKSTAVLEEEEERRKETLTSEDHALLLQDKLIEKEESLLKAMTATRAAEIKFEHVRDESDALRKELSAKIQQLEEVELNLKPIVEHHDNEGKVCVSSFGTQTDSFLSEGDKKSPQTCLENSGTVNALTGSLKDLKTENQEQRRRYESNINVLTRKLKLALKNSKMLEEEVKTLSKKLSERTTLQKFPADVDCPETTPPVQQILDVGSRNKDIKTNYYRRKISVLEIKVTELQRLLEVERQRANKTQDLLIDMEKQRGKLDALAKNSSSLRQQASELEAALSERETALSELDLQARDAEVRERQKENHLKDSLRETQKKLASEQETVKELRKQIFKEKCENSGLRKDIVSLKSILEVANRSLEIKKTEMAAAEHDLEEQHNSILKLRAEIGDLELKLAKSKEEVDKLKKKVEAGQAKDPLLADQIKTLSWHLRDKNQEIISLKNQLEQSGDRYRQELNRLEQAVNFNKKEMDEVRSELCNVSEERLSYQTKVTELRAALKTTMKQNEALRGRYSGRNSTNDDDVNRSDIHFLGSPAPFDESLIASLLQQSLSLPEISRPLSNLQVCVNTLKQEMAILQQQLLEQSNGQS